MILRSLHILIYVSIEWRRMFHPRYNRSVNYTSYSAVPSLQLQMRPEFPRGLSTRPNDGKIYDPSERRLFPRPTENKEKKVLTFAQRIISDESAMRRFTYFNQRQSISFISLMLKFACKYDMLFALG